MTKHEQACYFYDRFMEIYVFEQEKNGISFQELDNSDVELYFELKDVAAQRKKDVDKPKETTIDQIPGFKF